MIYMLNPIEPLHSMPLLNCGMGGISSSLLFLFSLISIYSDIVK